MEFRETLAKFFGIKKKEVQIPVPTSKPEQPYTSPGLPPERVQRREQRSSQRAQAVFSHQVEQAKTGRTPSAPDVSPEAVQKRAETVATKQTLETAEEVRARLAPIGTPGERYKRLTQTPQEKKVEEPPKEPSLKKVKTEEPLHDAARLEKSLKTPLSEWGRPKTSVPPFVEGTFPGVEKWKPGKGNYSKTPAAPEEQKKAA